MPVRYPSPLRYPGGKSKLAPYLARLLDSLPPGGFGVEVIIEPFAGGAGASLGAIESHDICEAWLVEANPALRAFWSQALSSTALADAVERTTVDLPMFMRARERVAAALAGEEQDQWELALAAFVVNRCSRSGMVMGGVGPIGGMGQSGRWTVGSRFNAGALADRLRRVAGHGMAGRVRLLDGDDGVSYLEGLEGSGVEDEVLALVDPPYTDVGARLYSCSMGVEGHERLARVLTGARWAWIATYDDSPQVARWYGSCRVVRFEAPHSVAARAVGSELLIAPWHMPLPGGNPLGRGRWEALPDEGLTGLSNGEEAR